MITELTRRDLRDLLADSWSGRLTDAAFISRIYDLNSLPSKDPRFKTMAGDIAQHTPPGNPDWESAWPFDDDRLDLDKEDVLLRFVAETVHPAVAEPDLDVERRVWEINNILSPDGYELFPARAMSGRPVFSARTTTPRRTPTGPFSSSLVSGIAKVLAAYYSHTEIDSLFEDQDFPRPNDFGGNKVEKVKAWLRTADRQPEFDHWRGLGVALGAVLEPEAAEDSALRGPQVAIRASLGQCGMGYVPGGFLTTGIVSATPPAVLAVPQGTLPPQQEWEPLGQGGFGTVYAVRDEQLGIDFALKVFDPSPFANADDARARFLREAGILFQLRHENIIRIFQAGTLSDGRPFIKMERFDGENLQTFLDRRPVTAEESVDIIGRLAAALEHAHGRSIFHRDLKPSNVLVSKSLGEVRLIDFGLGILVEEAVARSRLTTSAHHFGGAYSAPELLENAKVVGPHVDVYSLGAIWFRLVVGRSPQGAGIDSSIQSSRLTRDLKGFLARCLSEPEGRPTVSELLGALRSWRRSQNERRRLPLPP